LAFWRFAVPAAVVELLREKQAREMVAGMAEVAGEGEDSAVDAGLFFAVEEGVAAAARHRAEKYLLDRSLFRRKSTGEVANAEFLELAFPPRYHYDILRALDYFRASDARPDPRMSEAIQLIESKRQPNGRWLLEKSYDEALALPLTETIGEPSRWNTLRALRVLGWFKQLQPQ